MQSTQSGITTDTCKPKVTWSRSTMRSRAKSTLRRQHKPRDLTAWLRTAGSVFWMPGKIYRKTCTKYHQISTSLHNMDI